ncbi:MAG: sel1 repeat family protein [Oxalobacter formigenes]|nr:sel1 repeat family protein [Oxalobacter formigenes]
MKAQLAGASAVSARITDLKQKAIAGDPQDQLRLGVMYASGVGSRTDYRSAIFWIKKAAEQGEPDAQMLAAMMFLEGVGVRRSYLQAARWAQLSAVQGNVISQLLMGIFMEDGAGVRRDMERAVYWYRQVAKNNAGIGAEQRLGTLYLEGKGVLQDTKKGIKWLIAAAGKGDTHAAFQLGMIYYDGRLVEQDYKEALSWYLKAAEGRNEPEEARLLGKVLGEIAEPGEVYTRTAGQMMKRGQHVIRDAWFYVGLMYETGRGTAQDMKQSRYWYGKAADAGDEIAQQRLLFLQNQVV